jgi:hypothetical protein
VLFRRNAAQDHGAMVQWDTLALLPRSAGSFVDTQVIQKITYEYQVAVVDSSGQSSLAELPVQARPFDEGVRPPVRKMTAVFAKESNSIKLDWTYQAGGTDRMYFIIYRSVEGGEFISLKSVPGSLRTCTDRALIGDGTYRYRIQAATLGGAESPLSETVSILVVSTQK